MERSEMNRINETFKRLKAEKKKAFIVYVTAGDPDINTTKKIVRTLEQEGADIVELGVPFSDPLADGPTIQRAIYRSLKTGCSAKKVLKMVKEIRKEVDIPLVFMTYYNIVFNYGVEKFIADSKAAGADGIIVPDLPLEESKEMTKAADKHDFCVIQLTAPTTPPERFRKIAAASRGFVYHVSLTGVTGARKDLSKKLGSDVKKLKKLTKKPLCVGFGISNPKQACDIAGAADGVIVGSAVIKIIENNLKNRKVLVDRVGAFVRSMARAVHGVRS
jgi:tryptophan synthase alpha chain